MGITKREIASELGVSKRTIANYIGKLGLGNHVSRNGNTDILDDFAAAAIADALKNPEKPSRQPAVAAPAIVRMKATDGYTVGTSLDNYARVDLTRNGGGEQRPRPHAPGIFLGALGPHRREPAKRKTEQAYISKGPCHEEQPD